MLSMLVVCDSVSYFTLMVNRGMPLHDALSVSPIFRLMPLSLSSTSKMSPIFRVKYLLSCEMSVL